MRIGSASGIAGHGEFSLICPVPDGETLRIPIWRGIDKKWNSHVENHELYAM